MTKRIHWKQEMKYLNALAEYIQSLGYEVEEPSTKHRDILDVWGKIGSKKCFVELYITIYKTDHGIIGYITNGDESEEAYLDLTFGYGLDTRFLPLYALENLKPLNKRKT